MTVSRGPRGVRLSAGVGSAVAVLALVAGCSGSGGGSASNPARGGSAAGRSATSSGSSSANAAARGRNVRWRAALAGWRLPGTLSRMVAVRSGGRVLLAGGLDASDNSTAAVTALDPRSGAATTYGRLAVPVHDSAGTMVGGRLTLFGGGGAAETDAVQQLPAGGGRATVIGHLPEPRSDLSAVTIGRTAYVVGGYTGAVEVPTVLATADGRSFRVVARLPVTVRYAAVTAFDGAIWVIGGEHHHRFLDLVQRIDPRTGSARIVGRLPRPRGEAVAVVVRGRIVLAGGRGAAAVDRAVLAGSLHGQALRWRRVAALPAPAADPGGVLVGGQVLVMGGEAPARSAAVRRVVASTR